MRSIATKLFRLLLPDISNAENARLLPGISHFEQLCEGFHKDLGDASDWLRMSKIDNCG
ncbi:MAG: hypothetical protein SGI77_09715 [Pirellulaceae bacterium]|nr:hypothetical protein [Pirellulaceae bacterium]